MMRHSSVLALFFSESLSTVTAAGHSSGPGQKCSDLKTMFTENSCCGHPKDQVHLQIRPGPKITLPGTNTCNDKKPTGAGWDNKNCMKNGIVDAIDQAGGDVSVGYKGTFKSSVTPITTEYYKVGLCPVNVHWHLGTEHRSEGEYDETVGKGPGLSGTPATGAQTDRLVRELGTDGQVRYGYACGLYDSTNVNHTTEYKWKHCKDMHVGETYEVHWPHSALGACHTPNQYQYPFYDGVFCNYDNSALTQAQVAGAVGVQGQVFTIVNDERYYYPNLIRGMIVDGTIGQNSDITAYTGSTTGTSRDNDMCSQYAPITWQVDRKCHPISASSFDKMCADMLQQRDDMSADVHPHGSRVVVSKKYNADNHVNALNGR